MEAVVADVMHRFQTDFFNYDKPQIEDANFKFPFIWIVGECHTHLLPLGKFRDMFFESEAVRYDYLRDRNPYSYYLDSVNYTEDYWFLGTESGLQSINREQAKAAIMDYISPAVQEWIAKNGPLPNKAKIPVIIRGITITKLKELVADCRNHDDDSLMECLKSFHNHRRVATDQHIEVYYNSNCGDFSFGKFINGECQLFGGIIFHGWPETGYQTNGSVQLIRHYGWSTHT